MNNDFSELIQHIDDKFTGVNRRFDTVDKKFDDIDKKFIAIDQRFDSIDNKFDIVNKRFDEMRSDFNDLLTAVDTYAHKADGYFQEMVALTHKVDRHEKWLLEIADKLGVKLKY